MSLYLVDFAREEFKSWKKCTTKHGLEWKFSNRELNCSLEDFEGSVVDIGVTIDALWSARGWSASDAVVAAISVDTGKFCPLSTLGEREEGDDIILSALNMAENLQKPLQDIRKKLEKLDATEEAVNNLGKECH
ncbi:unnamed protein product [Porites lobata]|uniref:Uncharacterized protein n=1 Tax=Porites lobata TaxID=104759 RepID=A0ABN8QGE6_9CNID|nr:unnamed protein product [Porites lobata]